MLDFPFTSTLSGGIHIYYKSSHVLTHFFFPLLVTTSGIFFNHHFQFSGAETKQDHDLPKGTLLLNSTARIQTQAYQFPTNNCKLFETWKNISIDRNFVKSWKTWQWNSRVTNTLGQALLAALLTPTPTLFPGIRLYGSMGWQGMQLEISHEPSNFFALRSSKLPSSGQLYKLKILRLLL